MLTTLQLLLPALIPSWRFFDIIAPSPRIELARLDSAHDTAITWEPLHTRNKTMPASRMMGRLIWGPQWNDTLFTVSCAERLMDNPTDHSIAQIRARITQKLPAETPFFRFRLIFIHRSDAQLEREVTYISPVFATTS